MSWSRREFLGASALGLLGALLPRSVIGHASRRLPGATARAGEFLELRRGVGIFTARGGTIGWLASPAGIAVVDSQYPDTAGDCLVGLRERSAAPLDVLINSHHHGDHTAGNGVFRSVVGRIVAHERVPGLQRRAAEASGAETAQAYADTTFETEWSVMVGDETVRAKHYGPAHTAGDCTIFFELADVVHLGDLVFNRAYPFIDRAGGASVQGWVALLEAVAAEHTAETIFVFGHANPRFGVTGSLADVLVQRDFLSAVLESAGRSIAAGRSREEATALERLPGFDDHAALSSRLTLAESLGAAYDELREQP